MVLFNPPVPDVEAQMSAAFASRTFKPPKTSKRIQVPFEAA
ncbi:MAG: hypothetical protein ACYC9Z_18600 [Casimicrobiaceae bacterium]